MNELNCWHFKSCRDMNELKNAISEEIKHEWH